MYLSCPSCETRFSVGSPTIRPRGRMVKCGRCRHNWRAMPDEFVEQIEIAPAPELSAKTEDRSAGDWAGEVLKADEEMPPLVDLVSKVEAEAAAKQQRPAWTGWLILFIVLALIGAGGYLFRPQIVSFWPPAERIYGLLDIVLEDPLAGLDIQNQSFEKIVESGQKVLLVTGEVVNLNKKKKPVPSLRAYLEDAEGVVLSRWTIPLVKSTLDAGERIKFSSKLNQPSDKAVRVRITFMTGG